MIIVLFHHHFLSVYNVKASYGGSVYVAALQVVHVVSVVSVSLRHDDVINSTFIAKGDKEKWIVGEHGGEFDVAVLVYSPVLICAGRAAGVYSYSVGADRLFYVE